MRMLHFWDAANALTLVALAAALGSALFAVDGRLAYAVVALMVSGLCDLFDGFIARRLPRDEQQKHFGGRLDSIVDLCSFGFAPAVLLYCSGLRGPVGIALLVLFLCSAAWRLAYFETVGLQEEAAGRYYVGLPTTYVALIFPISYLTGFWRPSLLVMVLQATTLLLAVAMVAPVPIRKPGGIAYAVFLLIAALLIGTFVAYSDRLTAAHESGTFVLPRTREPVVSSPTQPLEQRGSAQ